MNTGLPKDHIEYFMKTGKSFASFKNIPEAYKVILNNMADGEIYNTFSIMCIYNQNKSEVETEELKLRTKGIEEIYFELNDLIQKGFVQKIIINDALMKKIKTFQPLIFSAK